MYILWGESGFVLIWRAVWDAQPIKLPRTTQGYRYPVFPSSIFMFSKRHANWLMPIFGCWQLSPRYHSVTAWKGDGWTAWQSKSPVISHPTPSSHAQTWKWKTAFIYTCCVAADLVFSCFPYVFLSRDTLCKHENKDGKKIPTAAQKTRWHLHNKHLRKTLRFAKKAIKHVTWENMRKSTAFPKKYHENTSLHQRSKANETVKYCVAI